MIEVVDYDPTWPVRFEALRREYVAAMAAAGVPVVSIEHVGSTAVPGLAAKPRIDCDIVVTADQIAAASNVLVSLGFVAEGDLGVPERWAFREPDRLAGINTYIVIDGCLSLRNHLCLRETLRRNPELRDEYAAVKRRAGQRAVTLDGYGRIKTPVVEKILAVGGLSQDELQSIRNNPIATTVSQPR